MWYVNSIGLVKTPRGVTIDGVQHPRNIFRLWSKDELAAIGIKPASITAVDTRYKNTGELTWNTSGAEAVGTYATTDKDVATLKTSMAGQVNSIAASTLAKSDWMSIREADGGTAMPSDWKTYRAAVRTAANAKETAIGNLANMDAVKAYEAHPVTYTRKTGTTDSEGVTTWAAPNITTDTTVNKVSWTELGGHADSWPTAPDHDADPSFVSVANT
jgi:hypothetical protein